MHDPEPMFLILVGTPVVCFLVDQCLGKLVHCVCLSSKPRHTVLKCTLACPLKTSFLYLGAALVGDVIVEPEPIVGGCPLFAVFVKIDNQLIASPAPVVVQEPSPSWLQKKSVILV